MIFRRLGAIIIAVLLFLVTIIYMGPLTENLAKFFWLKPGVTEVVGFVRNEDVFRGSILQHSALEATDILPVYGSSELSALSEFHPSQVFNGKPTGFTPFLVGRGGSQDLIHALNLGAQGEAVRGKKLAVILSSQWFTKDGLTAAYFAQNFSPLQAYQTMFNSSLQPKTKAKIAKRLLQFPAVEEYPVLVKVLEIYADPERKLQLTDARYLLKAHLELAALELQDARKTALLVRELDPEDVQKNATSPSAEVELPWAELRAKAGQQGQAASANNRFGIWDTYYLKYIRPDLAQDGGMDAGMKLDTSPEYADLEILLEVLEQEGADPLFIIVPVNGRWYDYTELSRAQRQEYYRRAKELVEQKGFAVADFSEHEYDLYFLQDIMHLGWKGWVDVDEALDNFVHQGK